MCLKSELSGLDFRHFCATSKIRAQISVPSVWNTEKLVLIILVLKHFVFSVLATKIDILRTNFGG